MQRYCRGRSAAAYEFSLLRSRRMNPQRKIYPKSRLLGVLGDGNPLTPKGHPPCGGGTGDPRVGGGGESQVAMEHNENIYTLGAAPRGIDSAGAILG
jgi:hypothetical protein